MFDFSYLKYYCLSTFLLLVVLQCIKTIKIQYFPEKLIINLCSLLAFSKLINTLIYQQFKKYMIRQFVQTFLLLEKNFLN